MDSEDMKIVVTVSDGGKYAGFRINEQPTLSLHREGFRWNLYRDPMSPAVKHWRITPARESVKAMIPLVLGFLLSQP
jgi:hypothetical protein